MIDYDKITITNNFMFATVMLNERICKGFLERMLDIKIRKIVYLEREKTFEIDPYSKGIRLDVYVQDSDRNFDIELQCIDRKDLALRSRYYQGLLDTSFLNKGQLYIDLPESFILFVCLFDLFGLGMPVYEFRNACVENPTLFLNDKCHKIFYNVWAWNRESNEKRRTLLKYFCDKKAEDDFTLDINKEVILNRQHREWRSRYMTVEQEAKVQAYYAFQDGREEAQKALQPIIDRQAEELSRKDSELSRQAEELLKYKNFLEEHNLKLPD